MLPPTRLMNTFFTSHNYHIVVVVMVRTVTVYSHISFQVYSAELLSIVSMLYVRSPGLTHLITERCAPFAQHLPAPHPQPLAAISLLSFYMFCIFRCRGQVRFPRYLSFSV